MPMARTLAAQLGLAIHGWWRALGIVADDDGLETDLMPAEFARRYAAPPRTSLRLATRHDA